MRKLYLCFVSVFLSFSALWAEGTDYTRGLSIWFDTPNSLDGRAIWLRADGSGMNPDREWENASLPIGNGSLGANILGSVAAERITLNEKTLWKGGPNTAGGADYYWKVNKQSASVMEEIRQAFTDGDYEKAELLTRKNFNGLAHYVPREHEPDIARPEEAAGPGLLALHIQLVADAQRDGRGKRGLCVNAWNERRNDRTRGDEAPDLPSEGRREQMQHAQGDALEEPRLARHRAEGERPHHDPPPGSGECGERSLKRNAFRGRPKDAHEQARNIFGHDLRYPPADGPYRDPEGLHGLRGQAVRRGDKGDPDTKRDEEKRKSLTNALYCIGRKNHRILLSQETVTAKGEVLFRENRLHVDTTAICP